MEENLKLARVTSTHWTKWENKVNEGELWIYLYPISYLQTFGIIDIKFKLLSLCKMFDRLDGRQSTGSVLYRFILLPLKSDRLYDIVKFRWMTVDFNDEWFVESDISAFHLLQVLDFFWILLCGQRCFIVGGEDQKFPVSCERFKIQWQLWGSGLSVTLSGDVYEVSPHTSLFLPFLLSRYFPDWTCTFWPSQTSIVADISGQR